MHGRSGGVVNDVKGADGQWQRWALGNPRHPEATVLAKRLQYNGDYHAAERLMSARLRS